MITRKLRSGHNVVPIAALLCFLVAGCKQEPSTSTPPAQVTVARPLIHEITEWDEYSGRLEPVESVEIHARVSGYLQSVHFKDGQMVKKGDLLFVIDPRPYQVEVDRAQAELERSRIQAELAKSDLDRAKRLIETKAISEEDFDRRSQGYAQAVAAGLASQAALNGAKLNLEFTEVRAPIGGRTSRHLVSEGNLVSGGTSQSTLLTTIVPFTPLHVYFDSDEETFLRIHRLNAAGLRQSSRDVPNPVQIALSDETEFTHEGKMDFVDNRLDPETATMRGRAIIENPDGFLTPGLFARVRLIGRGPYQATLIPDEAIGMDQAQKFVLLVAGGGTVEQRVVKPGRLHDGLRIIEEGLQPEDQVIVKGLQRARPGAKVTIVEITLNTNAPANPSERGQQ